jgi:hypothetical protein
MSVSEGRSNSKLRQRSTTRAQTQTLTEQTKARFAELAALNKHKRNPDLPSVSLPPPERRSVAEVMSERFELLDIEGDISGKLRLIYGSGPADPASFVLTLTPQYVARASGKTPPVSFHEIERYADENAGDLREMAFREKATGRLNLTLE